VRSHRYRF